MFHIDSYYYYKKKHTHWIQSIYPCAQHNNSKQYKHKLNGLGRIVSLLVLHSIESRWYDKLNKWIKKKTTLKLTLLRINRVWKGVTRWFFICLYFECSWVDQRRKCRCGQRRTEFMCSWTLPSRFDMGWRIGFPKFPRLAQVDIIRNASRMEHGQFLWGSPVLYWFSYRASFSEPICWQNRSQKR